MADYAALIRPTALVNPRHKQKLREMAAAWDTLAVERKLDLDEKNPD
jgi:hypothetical protein